MNNFVNIQGCYTSEAAARQPEVAAAVEEIGFTISRVEEYFGDLEKRLSPVTASTIDEKNAAGEIRRVMNAPLAGELQARNDRLRALESRIQYVLSRLEI